MHQGRVWLISYLYIIQGLVGKISETLILTYNKVPNYFILSIFEVSRLMFSLKFLIAPFVEKYTSFSYGRRKTWVTITCIGIGVFCFVFSFFTTYEQILVAAWLGFPIYSFLATQDIVMDALSIKQLQEPERISFTQVSSLTIGQLFGSFLLMKLISRNFGIKIGLQGQIMQLSTYIRGAGIVIFVVLVYFHFSYEQPVLDEEIQLAQQDVSLWETFKVYKIFLNTKRKEFRLSVLLFVMFQGSLFYISGYQIEIIKKGFNKEQINQLQSMTLILSLAISYFYNKWASSSPYYFLRLIVILRSLLCLIGFLVQPDSYYGVLIFLFLQSTMSTIMIMNQSIAINSVEITEYAAMTVCALNSMRNLGDSSFLHMWIMGFLGFRTSCIIGFVIQFLLILMMGPLTEWVQKGEEGPIQIE